MEIGGQIIVKIALFKDLGIIGTLDDHVERHRYWICRINRSCGD